ncbi:hypothetical protein HDU98_008234 [Podochytrium sp. JEL0797]|nr:hypothetical protein HDU98_008234 [Podochytrium sp. JEL0797]
MIAQNEAVHPAPAPPQKSQQPQWPSIQPMMYHPGGTSMPMMQTFYMTPNGQRHPVPMQPMPMPMPMSMQMGRMRMPIPMMPMQYVMYPHPAIPTAPVASNTPVMNPAVVPTSSNATSPHSALPESTKMPSPAETSPTKPPLTAPTTQYIQAPTPLTHPQFMYPMMPPQMQYPWPQPYPPYYFDPNTLSNQQPHLQQPPPKQQPAPARKPHSRHPPHPTQTARKPQRPTLAQLASAATDASEPVLGLGVIENGVSVVIRAPTQSRIDAIANGTFKQRRGRAPPGGVMGVDGHDASVLGVGVVAEGGGGEVVMVGQQQQGGMVGVGGNGVGKVKQEVVEGKMGAGQKNGEKRQMEVNGATKLDNDHKRRRAQGN